MCSDLKKRASRFGRAGIATVDLLVYIVIFVSLIAIGLPKLLEYRDAAYIAAAKSDAHQMLAAQEARYAMEDRYTDVIGDGGLTSFNGSPDVERKINLFDGGRRYCAVFGNNHIQNSVTKAKRWYISSSNPNVTESANGAVPTAQNFPECAGLSLTLSND